MCVCVLAHMHMNRCLQRPEESTDPLKLKLQKVMSYPVWVLRTRPGSLATRVANILSPRI